MEIDFKEVMGAMEKFNSTLLRVEMGYGRCDNAICKNMEVRASKAPQWIRNMKNLHSAHVRAIYDIQQVNLMNISLQLWSWDPGHATPCGWLVPDELWRGPCHLATESQTTGEARMLLT